MEKKFIKNGAKYPLAIGEVYPYKGKLLCKYEYQKIKTQDNMEYLIPELTDFVDSSKLLTNKELRRALELMKQSYKTLIDLEKTRLRIDEDLVNTFKSKLKEFESILGD